MAEDKVHVGDIGTVIEVDLQEDLSDVSHQELRVQKPDGTEIIWPGTIAAQTVTYTTESGDIDMPGKWIIQAHVRIAGSVNWHGIGDAVVMEVYPDYAAEVAAPIGWFADLQEAQDAVYHQRLSTEAWDDLDDHMKEKAIYNAYNRLYYDPRWDLPTYAAASASDLVKLQLANAEMAYYLIVHQADEDIRKGIQAQGVVQAGIVKEMYSEAMLMEVPVPPFVIAILSPWSTESNFAAINLERDEEEEDIKF